MFGYLAIVDTCTAGAFTLATIVKSKKHKIKKVGRNIKSDDRTNHKPVVLIVVVDVAIAEVAVPTVVAVILRGAPSVGLNVYFGH